MGHEERFCGHDEEGGRERSEKTTGICLDSSPVLENPQGNLGVSTREKWCKSSRRKEAARPVCPKSPPHLFFCLAVCQDDIISAFFFLSFFFWPTVHSSRET